jgi:hypothetical protein
VRRVLVAYSVSAAVSLLGLVAVLSPYLAANDAPLSGRTGLTLIVAAAASFFMFLRLTQSSGVRFWFRVLNGVVASMILPLLLVSAPLLTCIFVTHGACS